MGLPCLVPKPQQRERPMSHRRDWSKYNKHLVNRGKINFWIKRDVLKPWKDKRKRNGRPFLYSDELIKAMVYIRFKFKLSLRETEGFFRSLIQAYGIVMRIPSYTQLCRRMQRLQLTPELLSKQNVTDIVLDTTGLKVYGEGEWRAAKYGGTKTWRKLHLAMDPKSGKLMLAELTHEHVSDVSLLERALQKANRRKGRVLIDGIADTRRCHKLAHQYNKRLLTPPRKGAVFRREKEFADRNEAIRAVRGLGGDRIAKSIWAKLSGYSRRVVVESMVSRWKRVLGADLRSRCQQRRRIEVQIKAMMINAMIDGQAA